MGNDFYTIKTPATEEPVTLNEALDFCRVDQNSPDEKLVEALVTAATEQCENYTNRVFVSRTFTGGFACLDISNQETYPFIQLRRAPLVSITSTTIEIDGSPVAVSGVKTKNTATYARLLFTESLPSSDVVAYPLQVEFVAGYGAASDVPEDIKTAIKNLVLYLYENRSDIAPDSKAFMPLIVTSILHKYRIVNIFA